ncbi:hypothetical protein AB0K60_36640 [Thermopolyspora sp. NPDC052614]|uniref:hypothetical protein n=1 Tax=Thermopolyspora sp. NPDC052614 TaxID=3155682 RepID=UPI00342E9A77
MTEPRRRRPADRRPGNIGAATLDYLGSRRNIWGCCFALAGAGLVLLGLAGRFWPVVVAGLYGVGALLAPPERIHLAVSHAEVETKQLTADLDALLDDVRASRRFPEDVLAKVNALADALRAVLARAETLTTSPDHLHVVSQMIRDYLPSGLEAYANLPRTYALTRRSERERSAHEELLSQLDLLATELDKIAEAVYRGDEQSLRDQGRFLRDRFGPSRLDL